MYKKIKKSLRHLAAPFVSLVLFAVLVVFMLSVSPSESSFLISFIPLLLVWGILFSLSMSIRVFIREEHRPTLRYLSAVFATVGMLLLMFSALGQLALFDVSLLLMLAVLGVFYFRRSWPK